MIEQLRIVREHVDADQHLEAYIRRKIGPLDKYCPRRWRSSLRAEVMLRRQKVKQVSSDSAEVLLYLPHERATARATGVTFYAAIDTVEDKLKQQLKKYKDEHSPKFYRHLIRRLRARSD